MQVLDMSAVKGLKFAADAHGERNLIGQITIDLPSIGNIAIIGSKYVDRWQKQTEVVDDADQSEFHGAES